MYDTTFEDKVIRLPGDMLIVYPMFPVIVVQPRDIVAFPVFNAVAVNTGAAATGIDYVLYS